MESNSPFLSLMFVTLVFFLLMGGLHLLQS